MVAILKKGGEGGMRLEGIPQANDKTCSYLSTFTTVPSPRKLSVNLLLLARALIIISLLPS